MVSSGVIVGSLIGVVSSGVIVGGRIHVCMIVHGPHNAS